MKTEEKARKCWCPYAKVGRKEGCNRYPFDSDLFDGHAFARCIASDCMAWRWDKNSVKESSDRSSLVPVRGYCGIAGKPEA